MSSRIMIVDDSKAMRMIVRRTVKQAGFGSYEVEDAASGAEALQKIRLDPPRLVLSDWNMPDMSGYELLLKLREEGIGVAFAMITTEGTPEMRAKAASAGALFLLQKPFTSDELARALATVLR
ncbi:MAG: response regulator receiver protein [Myxococcaceae bacterium]|nr:response regulator receiver protein [Myxococcaceae bacterium]